MLFTSSVRLHFYVFVKGLRESILRPSVFITCKTTLTKTRKRTQQTLESISYNNFVGSTARPAGARGVRVPLHMYGPNWSPMYINEWTSGYLYTVGLSENPLDFF